MYCSQCGKKVMDTMLFCPFCGSPIVIPDQDEGRPAAAAPKSPVEENAVSMQHMEHIEPALPASEPEEVDDVGFIPLDLRSELWKEPSREEEKPKNADVSQEVSEVLSSQLKEEPVRLQGVKPDLSAARPHGAPKIASRKSADTYVPQRQFDPNDIFLDGETDEDEFVDYEDGDDFEYEEAEKGSFFARHIRGCVSLILFAVVAIVILGWMLSGSGQQALARAGLAWNPEVYAEVAYEAYQNGSYALAGGYYVKALQRDADNYDYANSAGVAYYMANDTLTAESMARKSIDINPARPEAYELLVRLYPDATARPLEIQGLIQTGYQLTGSESLNIQP